MATQKRYFDYGSPIKSKNSAEPFGLINGIGAILGFDRITNNTGNTGFIIGSNNADSIANKTKMVYLSDENGTVQNYNHAVITPDGIITAISGDLDITKPSSSRKEYMLVATHNYVASSEIESPTIFELIPNNTGTSFGDKVNLVDTNIYTWYTTIKSWKSEFNQGISVIVAFIDDRGDTPQIYTPFNNSWPIGSSPSTTGGSNIEEIYSAELSDDSADISIKSLLNIDIHTWSFGSSLRPIVNKIISKTNTQNTKSLLLKVIKLNNGLYSLRGSITYAMGLPSDTPYCNYIILQESAITTTDDNDNTHDRGIYNKYISIKNIGFTLNKIKEKLLLPSNRNLRVISGNLSIRSIELDAYNEIINSSPTFNIKLSDNLEFIINTSWDGRNSSYLSYQLINKTLTYDFDLLLEAY